MKKKLTNTVVEAFRGGARYDSGKYQGQVKPHDILWDTEVKGFGVRYAMKTGTRTYFLQCRVKGTTTERTISIGRHNDPWRIDQARARALELKAQMIGDGLTGVDVVAERKKQREEAERRKVVDAANAMTLRQLLEHFLEHHRTKHKRPLRPATVRDYKYHAKMNMADWLDQPVTTITVEACKTKFDGITKRGAPIQANLFAAYLRSLLNHFRKHNKGLMLVNPVTEMFELYSPNPETPRDSRIPLDKVGAVWNLLRERAKDPKQQTAADWASLLILTGARAGESSKLLWSNVDLEARTITFAADSTKTHAKLVLPMSQLLHDLLDARKPERAVGYVFATRSKTGHISADSSHATWKAISKVAGTPINRHDCRRTFDDIAMEVGVDGDARRLLLNHKSGGDVHSTHYANNRKALPRAMEAISAWVLTQAERAAGRNVVPLPTASSSNAA